MEGSYNKVFLAKGNIPAESYTFFIDILLDTIRCVRGQGPVRFRKSLDSSQRAPGRIPFWPFVIWGSWAYRFSFSVNGNLS